MFKIVWILLAIAAASALLRSIYWKAELAPEWSWEYKWWWATTCILLLSLFGAAGVLIVYIFFFLEI